MKLESIDDAKKIAFSDLVLAGLSKVPFGTFTKKDLECLLLYAFFESGVLTTRKSRELANRLEINETKLKSLLLDIRYKYLPDTKAESILALVKGILAYQSTKVIHENGTFIFAVEDPVQKIDFEQGMKDVGYYSDTSFNREIVKVRDFALVAFLFRMNNNDGTYADLKKMRKAATDAEQDLLRAIQLDKSWLEIGKDILETAKDAYEKVELLAKIAKFVTSGTFG